MAIEKGNLKPDISNMTVLEVVQLIEDMEESFGISASAAVTAAPSASKLSMPESSLLREVAHFELNQEYRRLITLLKLIAEKKRVDTFRETHLEFATALSMGMDIDKVKLKRVVPTAIYMGDGSNSEQLLDALNNFLVLLDFEKYYEDEPIISSFWKKMWFRTKTEKTAAELADTLEKTKRAIEVQQIDKPSSEADLNRAQAAAALMAAMESDSKSTAILHGGLLVLSLKDSDGDRHNRVLTLTTEQNEYMQQNLSLLKNPDKLLHLIDSEFSVSKKIHRASKDSVVKLKNQIRADA